MMIYVKSIDLKGMYQYFLLFFLRKYGRDSGTNKFCFVPFKRLTSFKISIQQGNLTKADCPNSENVQISDFHGRAFYLYLLNTAFMEAK